MLQNKRGIAPIIALLSLGFMALAVFVGTGIITDKGFNFDLRESAAGLVGCMKCINHACIKNRNTNICSVKLNQCSKNYDCNKDVICGKPCGEKVGSCASGLSCVDGVCQKSCSDGLVSKNCGCVSIQQPPQDTTCAKEGEMYTLSKTAYPNYPTSCCSDLTEWQSGMDTRKVVDGKCVTTNLVAGAAFGKCIKCGDGVCGTSENVCNCPSDCK
jgi:hypothetical protein